MLGKTWTQIDRQTDIWRDEQEEIQLREMYRQMDGETGRLMDKRIYRQMQRWTDNPRWRDEQTDRLI